MEVFDVYTPESNSTEEPILKPTSIRKISKIDDTAEELLMQIAELEHHSKLLEVSKGQYEGGFKIWECSLDLCSLMTMPEFKDKFTDKIVCELGCGQGLPGILAASKGANITIFQDLNKDVLMDATSVAIKANLSEEIVKKCKLMASSWETMLNDSSLYDVILSSETLYRSEMFSPLRQLLVKCLSPSGFALFSSKSFYFGMDGGTGLFEEYIDDTQGENGVSFEIKIAKHIADGKGNVREILFIKKK